MKQEINFQVGEECIYERSGGKILCKILERSWDGIWLTLKLKAIELIKPNQLGGQTLSGQIFNVSKKLDAPMWRIYEPTTTSHPN